MAESVLEHRFMLHEVLIGAVIGQGRLYQLWFISALLLVLTICCIANAALRPFRLTVQQLTGRRMNIVLLVLMTASFLVDSYLQASGEAGIRDTVVAPLRLITNGGYFLFGMSLHKVKRKPHNGILLSLIVIGYVGICITACTTFFTWASSFYPCLLCVAATLSIMLLCLSIRRVEGVFAKTIRYLAPATIGIWVLHPFAIAVLRKLLEFAGVELTVALRVLMVPVVLIRCTIVSKIASRIKGVRLLVRI